MNNITYDLLGKVVVEKGGDKKVIKSVGNKFLKQGLSKTIATRIFNNKNELKKLNLEELIFFADALYEATKNATIRLSKLFSEDELQKYYDHYMKKSSNDGYSGEEYTPRNFESLSERELFKLHYLNSKYGNKQMKQHSWYIYQSNIKDSEDFYEKDLYDFNREEIEDLMLGVIGSISTKNNTLSFVKSYLDYCVELNLINDNWIRYMDTSELIVINKDLINSNYVATKELNDELTFLEADESNNISPMDVMIVMLLRCGVSVKDMVKLKNSNFNFEKNTLFYKTSKGHKQITLEPYVVRWVEISRDMDGKIPKTRYVLNTLDDHIIRLIDNDYNEEQALYSVRRRLAKFKGFGFRPLNENLLITCKKIDMLDQIVEQNRELTTDDFKRVQEYFGNSASSYYKLKTEYQAMRGNEALVYKYSGVGKEL